MRCADCNKFFKAPGHFYGDRCGLNHSCQQCSEKESGSMKQFGYTRCSECDTLLWRHIDATNLTCMECLERTKTMPNIKITAEVDGKQVPLENISTETFEAIKALEKPKEIPVARVGHYKGEPDDRRLFLKVTDSIRNNIAYNNISMIAINLNSGLVQNTWKKGDCENLDKLYENIQPL